MGNYLLSEGLDEKKLILKEVKEVNEAFDYVLGASDEVRNDAVNETEMKANKFVEVFDAVKSEVDGLFCKDLSFRPCGFLFIGIATLLYMEGLTKRA
ncbi:hypothetical protein P8452_11127 [Trifolium repens]|nr:hypothetical protein QL285_054889 [Trifolium repens]WJX21735.1 hypothetical protein P8452_11127 [Trifolium repens]